MTAYGVSRSASPLIVALDVADLDSCRRLVDSLKGLVSYYKIGSELFTAHGWKAVELTESLDGKVFLDLKLHDIPTTVAKTSAVIARRGVFMLNVHALGGFEMMRQARDAVRKNSKHGKQPLVLGVTVLTSQGEKMLSEELGISRPLKQEVLSLARLTQRAGLDGVVCSPEETQMLRKELGDRFILVTPGIRPAGSETQDQTRHLTPPEALKQGANYIVVGRPITAASDPRKAAQDILQSLA